MVGDVQRIHELSLALSGPDRGQDPCLMRVTGTHENAVEVAVHGEGGPVLVAVPAPAAAELRIGDLLLGSVKADGSKTGTLTGMVIVVPADLERLLG